MRPRPSRRHGRALAGVGFAGFVLVSGLVWLAVWGRYHLPSPRPLAAAERAAVMAALRAAFERRPPPALGAGRALDGPLFVSVYDGGAPIGRVRSDAATLDGAVAEAGRRLGALDLDTATRARARLKVDLVLGRAPIAATPWLRALSVVPGRDGVGAAVGERAAWLLSDDLMREGLLSHSRPLVAVELQMGLDVAALDRRLAQLLGVGVEALGGARWFRFRADEFVEPADHASAATPLPALRGETPAPALDAARVRRAALAGGRYLLRHLYEDGRFGYEYDPARDEDTTRSVDYSLPRHAGAAFHLAELYHATGRPEFRDGAELALAFLERFQPDGGCARPERACVGDPALGGVDLGTTAMTLLAVSEHMAATGTRARLGWARRLGAFLVFMQRRDGSFCHLYDPRSDRRDERTQLLYYSGEAVLALAHLAALLPAGDAERATLVNAVDRGLGHLTSGIYDTFAGGFFVGEDHWTCIALADAWDTLAGADGDGGHRERYARFCDRFVAFMRRAQYDDDAVGRAQPDFVGGYGLGPFLPPHATPVGSRTETALATYAIQRRRGRGDSAEGRATRRQVELGLAFLLGHQIDDNRAWLLTNPEAARGGYLMSDVERHIRIDFVQHTGSAMLRALAVLGDELGR